MIIRLIFVAGVFATVLNPNLFGQFSLETEFAYLNDDNLDNNYEQTADRIAMASLGLAYDFETSRSNTQIFYVGGLNYYSKYSDRTFHSHSFGIDYSQILNKKETSTINANASYLIRINRQAYNFFDNSIVSMNASLKHYFIKNFWGQAGYSFQLVNYTNLPEFNYNEHMVKLNFSTYLPSKTTFIFLTSFGAKLYSSTNDSINTKRTNTTPIVTQLLGSLRIGQSVFENTGISIMAQYQTNLKKESRYLASINASFSDDELFDDHYGYEGLMLQGMLTQALPFDSRLRFSFSNQGKKYSNLPAYNLLGTQIYGNRSDIRNVLTIQLQKEFDILTLQFRYEHITNLSNDPFYDYKNNAFTIGLTIPF